MVILGICQDKGLMELFLQDARRLPAGISVATFDTKTSINNLVEVVKVYRTAETATLLVIDGEFIPASHTKALAEHSYATFTYYRQNGDRWFKFLKNRLKPVSVDYRAPEFWFMLGSIYTSLIMQAAKEQEISGVLDAE